MLSLSRLFNSLSISCLLAALPGVLFAQGPGIFIRTSCSSITSPVSGQSICWNATDNRWEYWNGSAWTAITVSGSTAFSGVTGGTNTSAAMVVGSGASLSVSGTGTNTATQVTSDASDPADAGKIRLGNAESIAWEASPAGTDGTLTFNASEQFSFENGQILTSNLGVEFTESDTNPACAIGNYNIYADLSETKLKKCTNGTASDLAPAEADTIQSVFDRGKTTNTATSFANAFRVTDSSNDGVAIYRDATNGPTVTCVVSAVENDCDKTTKLNTGKTYAIKDASSATLWSVTQAGVFTGLITRQEEMKLSSVSVSNANAFVDTIDATNTDYSAVRFVDAVTGDAFYTMRVPPNFTQDWGLVAVWSAVSGTGGNAVLTVSACVIATNAAKDCTLTALNSSATFAVNTSANITITTLSADYDATLALTAGNYLRVKFSREAGNASDTINADVLLEKLYFTWKGA